MVKKNSGSGRRKRDNSDDEGSESVSDTVSATSSRNGSDLEDDIDSKSWQEELIEAIELLGEKRAAKRMEALSQIISVMRKNYALFALSNYIDTITRSVFNTFSKASSDEESVITMKLLQIICLTLGGSAESSVDPQLVHKISQETLTLARSDSASTHVRSVALYTYAIWHFVDDAPEDLLTPDQGALKVVESFWPTVPSVNYRGDQALLAQALNSWSLLVSIVPPSLIQRIIAPKTKSYLMELVINNHSSFEVKKQAAEAICLLHENTESEEDERLADSELFEDLLDKLSSMSTHTDKQTHKKDKAAHKSTSRELLATLEDNESPVITTTVKDTTLRFESWAKVIQFHTFKDVLMGGITEHLMRNEFVRHVFDISHLEFHVGEGNRPFSAREKKMYLSKNSAYNKYDTALKNKKTRQFANFLNSDE